MLYGIKAGYWDVFENSDLYKEQDKGLIARDPRLDIKKNGVIGIDFRTKNYLGSDRRNNFDCKLAPMSKNEKEAVNSIEFDNIIDENAKLLFSEINESINMEIENSIANKAAVTEVEKILKTLADGNVL